VCFDGTWLRFSVTARESKPSQAPMCILSHFWGYNKYLWITDKVLLIHVSYTMGVNGILLINLRLIYL